MPADEHWLEVQDVNGCLGKDSITANPKQCLNEFNIPTAFTSNSNAKKGVFQPLLFGEAESTSLLVTIVGKLEFTGRLSFTRALMELQARHSRHVYLRGHADTNSKVKTLPDHYSPCCWYT